MDDFIKNEEEAVQLLLTLAKQHTHDPLLAKSFKEIAKMLRKKPVTVKSSEKIMEQLFSDVAYWREQVSVLTCNLDYATAEIARLRQLKERR